MNVQLRVRLPALEHLRADSAVDWAQLHKGEVLAHGRDTLATLGLRHPQAAVHACLDPNDLILLELQLRIRRGGVQGAGVQLAQQGTGGFGTDQMDAFETLIDEADQDLYGWIVGRIETPPEFDGEILNLIKDFRFKAHAVRGDGRGA